MSCEKHGYTNNVFCPACDKETIASARVAGEQEAQGEPDNYLVPKDLMRILWNTCDYYANQFNYEPERIGGVLQGCPRGPQPTIEEITAYARMAMNALHHWRGYEPPPYAAPPAREPSVSVAELRELVEKWHREGPQFIPGQAPWDTCADELKALCDRAA